MPTFTYKLDTTILMAIVPVYYDKCTHHVRAGVGEEDALLGRVYIVVHLHRHAARGHQIVPVQRPHLAVLLVGGWGDGWVGVGKCGLAGHVVGEWVRLG
jgi:hypothetical protein